MTLVTALVRKFGIGTSDSGSSIMSVSIPSLKFCWFLFMYLDLGLGLDNLQNDGQLCVVDKCWVCVEIGDFGDQYMYFLNTTGCNDDVLPYL